MLTLQDPVKWPASRITEDDVKRAMVPFLKEFYRNRYEPRPGSEVATLDNVSSEGLVADVLLHFRSQDDTAFICACEATSRDKEQEVRFQLDRIYFLWDCAAFGAAFTALVYTIFYATQDRWLIGLGPTGNGGLLAGLLIIGFFLWYFTMANWRKYRYIMAVAQFKRYFAHEQWIALAEDVFPSPNDPYLVELRRQCVYHGFGLAIVRENGQVNALTNPSRLGLFGQDRQIAQWVTQTAFFHQVNRGMAAVARLRPKPPEASIALWNKVVRPVRENFLAPLKQQVVRLLTRPFGQERAGFDRFMTGHRAQKAIFLLALLLIVPMFVIVMERDNDDLADLERYTPARGGSNPEDQRGFVQYDPAPIPIGQGADGIPKQFPEPASYEDSEIPDLIPRTPEKTRPAPPAAVSKGPAEEAVQTIDLSGGGDEEEEEPDPAPVRTQERRAATPAATAPSDPCAALRQSGRWFVQDNVYTFRDYAEERLAALQQRGITAALVRRSCAEPRVQDGYLIYLGPVQSTEAAARSRAAQFEKTLARHGLKDGRLVVRKTLAR
jgi:cell division protein FtsN